MTVGVAFFFVVVCSGFAVLRPLRLPNALIALGLAPAAGLASLALVASLVTVRGLPLSLVDGLLVVAAVVGAVNLLQATSELWQTWARSPRSRVACLVLVAALSLTSAIVVWGCWRAEVPLWLDDGPFHVEHIDSLRRGQSWAGGWWPGLHASAAAFLLLFPGVDTAAGAFWVSLAVIPMAVLVVFGCGMALWDDPLPSALGALFLALTWVYLYDPNFVSSWAQMWGSLIAIALWATSGLYIKAQTARHLVLAILLAAGLALTHASDAPPALLGGLVILVFWRERVAWRRLALHSGICAVIGIAVVAPALQKLDALAHPEGPLAYAHTWALSEVRSGPDVSAIALLVYLARAISGVQFVDLAPRFTLLIIAATWAVRHRAGRIPLVLFAIFLATAVVFAYPENPTVQFLSEITFPWTERRRVAILVAGSACLLQGAAFADIGTAALRIWWQRLKQANSPSRSGAVAAVAALVLLSLAGADAMGIRARLGAQVQRVISYTPDDAAAMAWLRGNVGPTEIVANDWMADAGIWAPYKAGVRILIPRLGMEELFSSPDALWCWLVTTDEKCYERLTRKPDPSTSRRIDQVREILDNIGRLERAPEAYTLACSLGVRYVYRGAAVGSFQGRHFPTELELRRSPALDTVFQSGKASVFRVRCPP